MSVGAGVYESYWTDPLTLATKAVTDKGITVVAAAGNLGKNAARPAAVRRHHGAGQRAVGADRRRLEHDGHADAQRRRRWRASARRVRRSSTSKRSRTWSRRAPAPSRWRCPGSTFYLDQGAVPARRQAPARLEAVSDAERHQHGGAGRQRHGRADAAGESEPDAEPDQGDSAVHRAGSIPATARCARAPASSTRSARCAWRSSTRRAQAGDEMPVQKVWSRQIIWGNHRLTGGVIKPSANAWAQQHRVGHGQDARRLRRRQHRVGHDGRDGDNIVWGTASDGDNIVWGTVGDGDNIVWGTRWRRRQHRVGHRLRRRRLRQHRLGHGRSTATTSCGARPRPATTSCGARRRRRQHRVGHVGDADVDLGRATRRRRR